MKFMHTRLPDFYEKIDKAAHKVRDDIEFSCRGLEAYTSGKLASLRVGRVEEEIIEITQDEKVKKVEVILAPEIPETCYVTIVKGYQEDGTCKKAILDHMMVSAPTVEMELFDVEEVIDRGGPGMDQF